MKKFKRVLALAMAVILSVPTIITTGMGTVPVKAAGDTVELTVSSESVKYAGYETRKMYAGGNYAYCVQPSKKTPQSGTYEKHYDVENYVSNAGDKTQAVQSRNLAYYCWGAPGFDAKNFPSTWYDGSAMNDDRYIALSHIMLSFLVSYDEVGSMHGCNSSFKNWVYQNVLGYNANGDLVNGQAPLPILCWTTAPASFKVYILSTGSATQNILGYEYTPTGTVSLSKTSANTGITSGNSCYSLAGAVYGIYSDAGCSAQVTTLTTDAGGNAAAVSLNAGTYYYKELTAPAGYALDSSVQSFTVTDGQNTALSVSDTPTNDPVRISINKVDSETGDKVQGGASLENAEFTVKYYAGYYNAGNLPANATRTWVIKTVKIGGVYVAGLNNTCKVYLTYQYTVKFGNISATAYCVQPSKPGLGSGTYTINKVGDGKALAKVCYYGTKASGDDGFFTEENGYGNLSAGARFMVHIVASYVGSEVCYGAVVQLVLRLLYIIYRMEKEMSINRVSINDLSQYSVLMYDDGTIRLFYSSPQEISVEKSVIRIGSMQVINRNEVVSIMSYNDILEITLVDGKIVELQIVKKALSI